MKKRTTEFQDFYPYYPKVVTLVGVKVEKRANFMAVAWDTPVSLNPLRIGVSISPERYTYQMIKKAGDFTCNFLTFDQLDTIHKCGRLSGTDVDKVKTIPIQIENSEKIISPGIKSAYAILECTLDRVIPCGDHDLFVGKVELIHYKQEYFDEEGLFKGDKFSPVFYLGPNTYVTLDKKIKIKKEEQVN